MPVFKFLLKTPDKNKVYDLILESLFYFYQIHIKSELKIIGYKSEFETCYLT